MEDAAHRVLHMTSPLQRGGVNIIWRKKEMERKLKKIGGGGLPMESYCHIVSVELSFAAALSVIYPLFQDCHFAFLFSHERKILKFADPEVASFFGCTRPRSAGRNHQKDVWWFPERVGNPLSSPRSYLLFGGAFSLGWRGRSGRSGRGGLRSAPMLIFVVCEGGRVVRGGGHTDVSIGLSACLLSGVVGSCNFFPRKRG